ncbi:HAD family hydrolase [Enterococcus sp. 5H]|uniref:HAD family hydrolase n=1 Tax=Enterococcus sp. 5H TaxID=1229490 RepID=UPI002303D789|nr:HAD family hydrolase [Enterococcus sp. 5H]
MLYKSILFDLDGTITNSAEGIIQAVLFAVKQLGLKTPNEEQLYSFIGPPLADSFEKLYGLNDQEVEKAVAYYREYYQKKGIFESHVYKGIPEVLASLKEKGCQLYLATSKPEIYAKQILNHFNLTHYFKGIYGASLDGKRSKKGDVIQYALKEANILNLKETIMIGDRSHDILGAKENDLASIGVLYGFGNQSELEIAGASYIVSTPTEIISLL